MQVGHRLHNPNYFLFMFSRLSSLFSVKVLTSVCRLQRMSKYLKCKTADHFLVLSLSAAIWIQMTAEPA
jgi:hypothetical protein